MQATKSFLHDCLRLLWMVFFRPNSFRREVEKFDGQQRRRLITQAFVVTATAPFLLTTLTGLLLQAAKYPFNFITNFGRDGAA